MKAGEFYISKGNQFKELLSEHQYRALLQWTEEYAAQKYLLSNESKVRKILNRKIESLESENLEMKKQNTELAEILKKSVRVVKQMDDHTKKCIDNI